MANERIPNSNGSGNGIEIRELMAKELEDAVIEPLELLAGLLSNVNPSDDDGVSVSDIGRLLALVVGGARRELKIQRIGGYGAYTIMQWLGDTGNI